MGMSVVDESKAPQHLGAGLVPTLALLVRRRFGWQWCILSLLPPAKLECGVFRRSLVSCIGDSVSALLSFSPPFNLQNNVKRLLCDLVRSEQPEELSTVNDEALFSLLASVM